MEYDEVKGTWCQMCGPSQIHCYTRCYIKDGKWVGVEGCPNAANNGVPGSRSLCAKGQMAPRSLDSSQRLLYPQRRIGPKGPGARFERIGWDEAIEQIASTLMEQKEKYGPETFGILSPQAYPVLSTIGRRFLNLHGSPNYLHSAICFYQRQASCNTVVGGPSIFSNNSTIPAHMEKSELIVCWGANPENATVNQGGARKRLAAKRAGAKLIDIRPMLDPLAAHADIWLPVRPGTDLALALGFLNVIIGEGLYDRAFVRDWCTGFGELAEHVRQHTPEWAAERCGIPAQQIREVARMIAAAKPCGIIYGNGVGDQARDGHWTICAIQLVGAICGNLGKPGGGADGAGPLPPTIPLRRIPIAAERLQPSEEDIANGWPAGASKLVAPEFPRWYVKPGSPALCSGYFQGLRSIVTGEPFPLRSVFAQCTNPLSATRQPALVREALEKVDFFFAMDMFHNPSCDYADIVLPAASHYECSHQVGMVNSPRGTFVGMCSKLQDPPGEALSDWELYFRLAVACGYGDDFWGGSIEACLDEQLRDTGYTAQQLREMPDGLFVPRDPASVKVPPSQPDYGRMFAGLPEGKLQCANLVVGGKPNARGDGLLPALPVYRGPAEGLAETPELAREYPLVFSDVHAHKLANHSYYNDIAELRRHDPHPWVRMNPATAASHGISEGDWVRIESPHGWCVLSARLTEGIAPEVLMGRRGWWQGCPELGIPGYSCLDGGAEPNVHYSASPQDTDEFHSSMGKSTLVRICKWEEGPREYV